MAEWQKVKTIPASVKVFIKEDRVLFEVCVGGNLLNEWTEPIEKVKRNGWIE